MKYDESIDKTTTEVINKVLEIPGVKNAVLIAALNHTVGGIDIREQDSLGDVPFQYIWDTLFNPEELP